MVNKLIQGLYNFIFNFVGTFTTPVSNIFNQLFPDLTQYVNQINNLLTQVLGVINWFIWLIPKPFTLAMLGLFFATVSASAVFVFTFWLLGLTLDFIKRLNIFGSK